MKTVRKAEEKIYYNLQYINNSTEMLIENAFDVNVRPKKCCIAGYFNQPCYQQAEMQINYDMVCPIIKLYKKLTRGKGELK